jgi:hypothetical protein
MQQYAQILTSQSINGAICIVDNGTGSSSEIIWNSGAYAAIGTGGGSTCEARCRAALEVREPPVKNSISMKSS